MTVSDGDDLQQSADGRAIYADFRVGEINTAKGEEFMELRYPGGEVFCSQVRPTVMWMRWPCNAR